MTTEERLERIEKLIEFHVIGHVHAFHIPKSMTPPLLARINRLRDELWSDAEDHRPGPSRGSKGGTMMDEVAVDAAMEILWPALKRVMTMGRYEFQGRAEARSLVTAAVVAALKAKQKRPKADG